MRNRLDRHSTYLEALDLQIDGQQILVTSEITVLRINTVELSRTYAQGLLQM
jgi:hypothetical protein